MKIFHIFSLDFNSGLKRPTSLLKMLRHPLISLYHGMIFTAFYLCFCLSLATPILFLTLNQTIASEKRIFTLASTSFMACMERCIKYEGNTSTTNKTCKMRCSNISLPSTETQKLDCMDTYKNCRKLCQKKDTTCRRSCKQKLNTCT